MILVTFVQKNTLRTTVLKSNFAFYLKVLILADVHLNHGSRSTEIIFNLPWNISSNFVKAAFLGQLSPCSSRLNLAGSMKCS